MLPLVQYMACYWLISWLICLFLWLLIHVFIIYRHAWLSGMTLSTRRTSRYTWIASASLHKALRRMPTAASWKIWLPSTALCRTRSSIYRHMRRHQSKPPLVKSVQLVIQHYIKRQPNFVSPWRFGFRSLSETFFRRISNNLSSGSCHSSDETWQEIGRSCRSMCICPRRPSFRMCTASLIHLVPLSDSLSSLAFLSGFIQVGGQVSHWNELKVLSSCPPIDRIRATVWC